MDTVDQDTAALEQLVFAADTAFKKVIEPAPPNADALHEAELALTQLQMMLTYLGSRSEHEGWHSQPLMEDCLSRLQRIRLQASTTESRCNKTKSAVP